MDKFQMALATALVIATGVILHGFWSLVLRGQSCGGLAGYVFLSALTGLSIYSARAYRKPILEILAIFLVFVYFVAVLYLFYAPPDWLTRC